MNDAGQVSASGADFHQMSAAGNRYLLVVVGRVSKFFFGYRLASKGPLAVSRKLMKLVLTFGVPQSIRSDGGGSSRRKWLATCVGG